MLVSGSGEWSRGTKRGRRKDPNRTSEWDDDPCRSWWSGRVGSPASSRCQAAGTRPPHSGAVTSGRLAQGRGIDSASCPVLVSASA